MLNLSGVAFATTFVFLPSAVAAHGGHLGELAGHSHWVGIAALAGAALVAGLVTRKGRKSEDQSSDADTEADGESETAR